MIINIIIIMLLILVAIPLAVFFYWKYIFLRDPERKPPKGHVIVSPADGKVIAVEETGSRELKIKKGLLGKIRTMTSDVGKDCYVVSIFMGLLDVHVNRAPVGGKVLSKKHKKGKFVPANSLENALENEKTEMLVENKKIGKYKVIQIAGFFARRVFTFPKIGDMLLTGDRIGVIDLGSQVTIILPKKVKLKVKKGQKLKAGLTVIAKY